MWTSRLKWYSFLGLVLFVLALDGIRTALYPIQFDTGGRLLLDGFVLTGGIFLLGLLFAFLERQEARLERQRAELLALHHAAIDLGGELGLAPLLQKIVDGAHDLVATRYGALSVIDRAGRIEAFVTAGISEEQRVRLGDPPVGRGLLGVTLHHGKHLRLVDLASDPRSAGFPAHHPKMSSLLAVPIACRSPFRGNLYLADKLDGEPFDESDEATLVRFATQAANAIDAVHLHEQLRAVAIEEERLRLAREMHDGVAQILASVNARAQAIREHLRAGRAEDAIQLLERLAADARSVHAEVREGILALRSSSSTDGIATALKDYLEEWQDQTGIAVDSELEPAVRFLPEREVQVLRIVQEALANVRKHAGASRVQVKLTQLEKEATLEVADDGRGFDAAAPPHDGRPRFGLVTMRERAQAVEGELEIETVPERGTRVRLRVPVGRGNLVGFRRSA
ncbi:MAG TPA: GAF domain-containing sensor histidine kinase [Thermoanaerobaculia bacterium]|jgi:signal transduction histidine kinase